ncbi:unnamed protein product [Closterium sp. NIES-64]|nr:unnamed protein product [Closterium sp. NIES-64]
MLDVAPLTFLVVFIVCTVGAWIVSKFFTQIVTLAIKVTTGNSLSFRVLGLLKVKDIHCAFKKGPIQSVTIREVKGHLASLSSLKLRLRVKIKDVDIVLRPSPPSTSKKKKKASKNAFSSRGSAAKGPARKAGAIAAAWGRWKLLGSFSRVVRVCLFDVSVRWAQAPDVCFQLREFDLFSTADASGKGQVAMRLELLGISLSHRPPVSEKSPGLRSRSMNLFRIGGGGGGGGAEEGEGEGEWDGGGEGRGRRSVGGGEGSGDDSLPLMLLESWTTDVALGFDREVGIAVRQLQLNWSELELNLSERLLALRIVKAPKRPPAAQPPVPAAPVAAAAVPVLVNERKRPNLPEKVQVTLPRIMLRLWHHRCGLLLRSSCGPITLSSTLSRPAPDLSVIEADFSIGIVEVLKSAEGSALSVMRVSSSACLSFPHYPPHLLLSPVILNPFPPPLLPPSDGRGSAGRGGRDPLSRGLAGVPCYSLPMGAPPSLSDFTTSNRLAPPFFPTVSLSLPQTAEAVRAEVDMTLSSVDWRVFPATLAPWVAAALEEMRRKKAATLRRQHLQLQQELLEGILSPRAKARGASRKADSPPLGKSAAAAGEAGGRVGGGAGAPGAATAEAATVVEVPKPKKPKRPFRLEAVVGAVGAKLTVHDYDGTPLYKASAAKFHLFLSKSTGSPPAATAAPHASSSTPMGPDSPGSAAGGGKAGWGRSKGGRYSFLSRSGSVLGGGPRGGGGAAGAGGGGGDGAAAAASSPGVSRTSSRAEAAATRAGFSRSTSCFAASPSGAAGGSGGVGRGSASAFPSSSSISASPAAAAATAAAAVGTSTAAGVAAGGGESVVEVQVEYSGVQVARLPREEDFARLAEADGGASAAGAAAPAAPAAAAAAAAAAVPREQVFIQVSRLGVEWGPGIPDNWEELGDSSGERRGGESSGAAEAGAGGESGRGLGATGSASSPGSGSGGGAYRVVSGGGSGGSGGGGILDKVMMVQVGVRGLRLRPSFPLLGSIAEEITRAEQFVKREKKRGASTVGAAAGGADATAAGKEPGKGKSKSKGKGKGKGKGVKAFRIVLDDSLLELECPCTVVEADVLDPKKVHFGDELGERIFHLTPEGDLRVAKVRRFEWEGVEHASVVCALRVELPSVSVGGRVGGKQVQVGVEGARVVYVEKGEGGEVGGAVRSGGVGFGTGGLEGKGGEEKRVGREGGRRQDGVIAEVVVCRLQMAHMLLRKGLLCPDGGPAPDRVVVTAAGLEARWEPDVQVLVVEVGEEMKEVTGRRKAVIEQWRAMTEREGETEQARVNQQQAEEKAEKKAEQEMQQRVQEQKGGKREGGGAGKLVTAGGSLDASLLGREGGTQLGVSAAAVAAGSSSNSTTPRHSSSTAASLPPMGPSGEGRRSFGVAKSAGAAVVIEGGVAGLGAAGSGAGGGIWRRNSDSCVGGAGASSSSAALDTAAAASAAGAGVAAALAAGDSAAPTNPSKPVKAKKPKPVVAVDVTGVVVTVGIGDETEMRVEARGLFSEDAAMGALLEGLALRINGAAMLFSESFQARGLFSEDAAMGALLEGLALRINGAAMLFSESFQVSRVPSATPVVVAPPSAPPPQPGTSTPTVWDYVIQASSSRFILPFQFEVRAVEDSAEDMMRVLKAVTAAQKMARHARRLRQGRAAAAAGLIRLIVKELLLEVEEEPIQGWLDERRQLMRPLVEDKLVRERLLEEEEENLMGGDIFPAGLEGLVGEVAGGGDGEKSPQDAAREDLHRRACLAYKAACENLVKDPGTGWAYKIGLNEKFPMTTTRRSAASLWFAFAELALIPIEHGRQGMVAKIRELDTVPASDKVPIARMYGRGVELSCVGLKFSLRDFPLPLFAAASGKLRATAIMAAQATVHQPQQKSDVFLGRFRRVTVLRTASGATPPLKFYYEAEAEFESADLSYGVGYEPMLFADVSYAVTCAVRKGQPTTRQAKVIAAAAAAAAAAGVPYPPVQNTLSVPALAAAADPAAAPPVWPPVERSLPWWDIMRYYMHGHAHIVALDYQVFLQATVDPYEQNDMLTLVGSRLVFSQKKGQMFVRGEDLEAHMSSVPEDPLRKADAWVREGGSGGIGRGTGGGGEGGAVGGRRVPPRTCYRDAGFGAGYKDRLGGGGEWGRLCTLFARAANRTRHENGSEQARVIHSKGEKREKSSVGGGGVRVDRSSSAIDLRPGGPTAAAAGAASAGSDAAAAGASGVLGRHAHGSPAGPAIPRSTSLSSASFSRASSSHRFPDDEDFFSGSSTAHRSASSTSGGSFSSVGFEPGAESASGAGLSASGAFAISETQENVPTFNLASHDIKWLFKFYNLMYLSSHKLRNFGRRRYGIARKPKSGNLNLSQVMSEMLIRLHIAPGAWRHYSFRNPDPAEGLVLLVDELVYELCYSRNLKAWDGQSRRPSFKTAHTGLDVVRMRIVVEEPGSGEGEGDGQEGSGGMEGGGGGGGVGRGGVGGTSGRVLEGDEASEKILELLMGEDEVGGGGREGMLGGVAEERSILGKGMVTRRSTGGSSFGWGGGEGLGGGGGGGGLGEEAGDSKVARGGGMEGMAYGAAGGGGEAGGSGAGGDGEGSKKGSSSRISDFEAEGEGLESDGDGLESDGDEREEEEDEEEEGGEGEDEGEAEQDLADILALLVADDCWRILVPGLRLLLTIRNRDALWAWMAEFQRGFASDKPSPSRQLAQRKRLEAAGGVPPPVVGAALVAAQVAAQIAAEKAEKEAAKAAAAAEAAAAAAAAAEAQAKATGVAEGGQAGLGDGVVGGGGAAGGGGGGKGGVGDGAAGMGMEGEDDNCTLNYMINIIRPQFNFHSEDAHGQFLLAAKSGRVLARTFHSGRFLLAAKSGRVLARTFHSGRFLLAAKSGRVLARTFHSVFAGAIEALAVITPFILPFPYPSSIPSSGSFPPRRQERACARPHLPLRGAGAGAGAAAAAAASPLAAAVPSLAPPPPHTSDIMPGFGDDLDTIQWNRHELAVMLENVQAYVAPTDVDLTAGVQWLAHVPMGAGRRGGGRGGKGRRRRGGGMVGRGSEGSLAGGATSGDGDGDDGYGAAGAGPSGVLLLGRGAASNGDMEGNHLLKQVFQPCTMYLEYTRYKSGSQGAQKKPLKEVSFSVPNITATMTSQQFQTLTDIIMNLALAPTPK